MGLAQQFTTGSDLTLTGVDAEGQPKTLKLKLGRINLTVMSKFSGWVQDVVIARARLLACSLPESGRASAIIRGVDILTKEADWGGPVCDSMLKSPMGLAKLIHFALVPEQQATVTPEEICDLIDMNQSDAISDALFKASGVTREKVEALGKSVAGSGQPTPPIGPA